MPIRNRLAELHPEITGWRRHLHQHPELLFDLGVTPGGRKRIRLLAMHVTVDALDPGLHDDALAAGIDGGTFDMEWPPKSGRTASFPEIDRAAWVTLDVAALKLSKNQRDAVERVAALATTIAAQPGS